MEDNVNPGKRNVDDTQQKKRSSEDRPTQSRNTSGQTSNVPKWFKVG